MRDNNSTFNMHYTTVEAINKSIMMTSHCPQPHSPSPAPFSPTSLTDLPPEIHLLITPYLSYPDALSLKHTNRHFYNLVYTGVNLKIEWLIERRRLHLDCPHDKACELGSDRTFCRGSVRLLMKRRREHGECETRPGGRGCLVFGTPICQSKKTTIWNIQERWVNRFKRQTEIALVCWLFIGLVGLLVGLGCAWFGMSCGEEMWNMIGRWRGDGGIIV